MMHSELPPGQVFPTLLDTRAWWVGDFAHAAGPVREEPRRSDASLGAAHSARLFRRRTERPRGDDRVPLMGAPKFVGPLRSFEAADLSSGCNRTPAAEGEQ
jgi:hypothetical protein